MKLILCAGDRHTKGYTHHDVKALPGVDIVCDLKDIQFYVKDDACERIEFTHALEHFPTKEVPEILGIVKAILAPGGELYIEVPNFKWHASILLNEGRDEDAVYYAFGGQEDEWDFHKTGFTPNILRKALEDAGFERVEVYDQSSILAKAYRP